MNDPYRIEPGARPSAVPRKRGGSPVSALLWILLAVGVAVNMVSNLAMRGELTPVGLAGGVVGLAAAAGLVVHHVNRRRP
ncbi:hypothetical protein AB0B56_08530 [Streptosporangium canum]|uniref:hypothetical protein n=1 Tax=Streptosporangium canum TaxID=324952 RepID=UPI0034472777